MNFKLLKKYAANRCSAEEVDTVLEWLQRGDIDAKNTCQQFWNGINSESSSDNAGMEQRLDRIHHRINIQREENQIHKLQGGDHKRRILKVFYRAAVVLLLPIITLFVYTQFFQSDFIASNEIFAPAGSRTFLELSDGTKVWLNYGSKMIYPQRFTGNERTVQLVGEGYFEVAHNPLKPFIVESGGMRVKAVGTNFNVKSYDDGTDFETTLAAGKVLIQRNFKSSKSELCEMVPGQHFILDHRSNTYSLRTEEIFKYVAWREGKLVFDNDPLNKVLEQLSRCYNVDIKLKDPRLSDLTYKATFMNESLSDILEMMQVVMPIACVESQRETTIDGTFMKKEILIYRKK